MKNTTNDINSLDLQSIFLCVWKGKWIILSFSILSVVISAVVSLNLPDRYKASALMIPAAQDENSLGRLAGQLGGLVSLAGVSLQSSTADKTSLGLQILKSRTFFESFIQKDERLIHLMAAKGWNRDSNELIIDSEIFDTNTREWVREVNYPQRSKPSVLKAHKRFLEALSITTNRESGTITISFEHYSPTIASSWVTALVYELNETIKNQDVRRAQSSVKYLEDQIKTTAYTELKSNFFELIEKQLETIMLANANPEYFLKTIDPAIEPEFRSSPKRYLICIVAGIFGAIFGLLIVILRFALIENDKSNI